MIVLNENDWAYDMIQSRSLGKKPYETLCRVANYYKEVEGCNKNETRRMVEQFIIQCNPGASIPKWSDTIDYAVAHALKYQSIAIDSIIITKPEIDIINSVSGKQARRLAFTLLCLAKYWDIVNPESNHWVNSKDSDIMRMANINTSIKRQSLLYHTLNEMGLIQFSKKVDNTNIRVLFMSDGDPEIVITDLRNLGYQYLMYCGEEYFSCSNCGITTKIKRDGVGRKPKYCPECANKIKIQQSVNSVIRKRRSSAHEIEAV